MLYSRVRGFEQSIHKDPQNHKKCKKNHAWKCSVFCTRFLTLVSRFGLHFGSILEFRRPLWSCPNRLFFRKRIQGGLQGPFGSIWEPKVNSKKPFGSILEPCGPILYGFWEVWGEIVGGFGAQSSAQKYAVRCMLYSVRCTLYAARCLSQVGGIGR